MQRNCDKQESSPNAMPTRNLLRLSVVPLALDTQRLSVAIALTQFGALRSDRSRPDMKDCTNVAAFYPQ